MMLINDKQDSNSLNKKKKKVSKNRKKSWRKFTDIGEYEDFLDDKRFEERIGHSIGDAKNDDLFIIEKTGNDQLYQKKLDEISLKQNERKSVNESKLRKITNEYRLYQKLLPTSKVSPILIQKQNSDRKHTVYNDENKLLRYWEERKDSIEQAKQMKQFKQIAKDDSKIRFNNNYDLWDDDEVNRNNLKLNKKKVPEHLRQKPSLLPAVELPLPGQSYNPSEKDHQDLLMMEVEKELQKINEEKMWAKKLGKFLITKKEAKENELAYQNEMLQGLLDKDDDEDSEENDQNQTKDDDELKTIILKQSKTVKRKTKQQKRRELREKLLKKQKEQEKLLRIKENDIFRLKSIEKQLNEREKRLAERRKIRQAKYIESLYKPKRLSRHDFEETPIELNLSNEISGSLCTMKIEGNLLKDRYKSLQRRNLIETRKLQLRKRGHLKRKMEMKRRHRD